MISAYVLLFLVDCWRQILPFQILCKGVVTNVALRPFQTNEYLFHCYEQHTSPDQLTEKRITSKRDQNESNLCLSKKRQGSPVCSIRMCYLLVYNYVLMHVLELRYNNSVLEEVFTIVHRAKLNPSVFPPSFQTCSMDVFNHNLLRLLVKLLCIQL